MAVAYIRICNTFELNTGEKCSKSEISAVGGQYSGAGFTIKGFNAEVSGRCRWPQIARCGRCAADIISRGESGSRSPAIRDGGVTGRSGNKDGDVPLGFDTGGIHRGVIFWWCRRWMMSERWRLWQCAVSLLPAVFTTGGWQGGKKSIYTSYIYKLKCRPRGVLPPPFRLRGESHPLLGN